MEIDLYTHFSTEIGLIDQTSILTPFFDTINDGQYVAEYERMITSDIWITRPVLTTPLQQTISRFDNGIGTRIRTPCMPCLSVICPEPMVRCVQTIL